MGRKRHSRSRSRDYHKIGKKLKKLERELQRYTRSSSSESSSRQQYDSYQEINNDYDDISYDDLHQEDVAVDEAVIPMESEPSLTNSQNIQATTSGTLVSTASDTLVLTDKSEEQLDPEILSMLGEDPTLEKEFGEDLQKDIAARWTHILVNGLSKESKSELLKTYLPPKNCVNMKAPKLNLEIEAALSQLNIKRDLFSQSKQNQLASCLASIGKVLNIIISSKELLPEMRQQIVKPLSDAGRLLTDCHYRESQSRRYAITNNLNKHTREVVKNTKIDEFLFGANLSDHLKSSKAISRSGLEMKSTVLRTPLKPPPLPTTQPQKRALNARGMARAPAFEPRQNPALRRQAPPARDRRHDSNRRRNYSARRESRKQ